jgi:hypothetical protein
MSKASELELSEIHGGMADWCKLILKGVPLMVEGKPVLNSDGQPWLIPPSSAHMNVIRQFLKDNKIDNPSTPAKVKDIVQELPDFSGEPAYHTAKH